MRTLQWQHWQTLAVIVVLIGVIVFGMNVGQLWG